MSEVIEVPEDIIKALHLYNAIYVKRIEAESKSRGGIIIPDTAKEKPSQGEVVAERDVHFRAFADQVVVAGAEVGIGDDGFFAAVFQEVDDRLNLGQHTARGEMLLLDISFEDGIQDTVWRERIFIFLVGPKLCCRWSP